MAPSRPSLALYLEGEITPFLFHPRPWTRVDIAEKAGGIKNVQKQILLSCMDFQQFERYVQNSCERGKKFVRVVLAFSTAESHAK
jgi:hypothetical protein